VYRYAPFVVTFSENGEPQPIYGGLYTIRGYTEGYFFSDMDSRIIYGLVHHRFLRHFTIAQDDIFFR
jgi:hypothetical protein